MLNIYYDKDADLKCLRGKTIAIVGYGSQGHAHALNLKESGMEVIVGLREGASWQKAERGNSNIRATGLKKAERAKRRFRRRRRARHRPSS